MSRSWTSPTVDAPEEVGFADLERRASALADEWSSYWYNGRIFSNSGLHRREPLATANRGVDVYRPSATSPASLDGAKTFCRFNPQTQEAIAGSVRHVRSALAVAAVALGGCGWR